MDWRMISVCFSIFQFVFMAVIFAVLKFNDMNHLDKNLTDLKKEFQTSELKNSERHIQNLEAINKISVTVSNLSGKFEASNSK